jgi:tetratricopeptide (TPR) repeat protein
VDAAAAILRKTADVQDKIGKGETEMPAREMRADMLLDAKRYEAALQEYEVSLKTDPNRFSSLYGAAQAAEALGKSDQAKNYYAELLKNCEGVDSSRAELLRARGLVAAR